MYRRALLSREVKRMLTLLMCTLCILLIGSSVYFFIKATDTAERGYLFQEYTMRQKNLEFENRVLHTQVLEAQSLDKLKKNPLMRGMVESEKPIFVAPKSPFTKNKNSRSRRSIY